MSGSHPIQEGTSLGLELSPEVDIDNSSLADDAHDARAWIRSGLAKLPPELIQLVCRQLCRCWYCKPRPYPLYYFPDGLVAFRDDLDSLSRTCKFLCAVAQPYLFHDIEGPSPDLMKKFRRHNRRINNRLLGILDSEVPHIANHVRRITLNSITNNLSLLRRLTGLRSLRVLAFSAGGIRLESYLSFPCLRELHYGPLLIFPTIRSFPGYKVGIENARKDLRALLQAAPSLSHLSCHRLWHDVSLSPFILLKLPACQITTLELHECWLPRGTFIRFMANFPLLKSFRLWSTMSLSLAYSLETSVGTFPTNGPGQIADAADVVVALEPCKKSLERLDLDFGFGHEYHRSFRFLTSMESFSSLRILYLSQGAIGNYGRAEDVSRDTFTKLLTSSIEELRITDFLEAYRDAVLDFAKQTAAGAYPNLAHVRLIPWNHDDDDLWWGFMSGQDFLKFASGQDVSQLPVEDIITGAVGIELDIEESTHQLLPGEEGDEEGDEEAEHQEASEQNGSEADLDFISLRQDWVAFGRRCLNDNDFTSKIARHFKEDSVVCLTAAIQNLSLRNRIQSLFSKEYVLLECVAVHVGDEDGEREVAYF